MTRSRLKAKWLFPDCGPPIENGVLTIVNGRVESIQSLSDSHTDSDPSIRDLGSVALLPGLVNAHTHLEFSDLEAPIGDGSGRFADWIRAVLQQRGSQSEHSNEGAITAGLVECHLAGVTALGEIATSMPLPVSLQQSSVCGTAFLELIGISATRRTDVMTSAREFLESVSRESPWRCGLSPHAPYTTSLQLVKEAVELACRFETPIAMHLAETKEELQLLDSHGGPLRELLDERQLFDTNAFPVGTRALDYLKLLAKAPFSLVIHGNYLDDEELRFLGSHSDRMRLVYCPRTHSYFQHDPYPLRKSAGPWSPHGVRHRFASLESRPVLVRRGKTCRSIAP